MFLIGPVCGGAVFGLRAQAYEMACTCRVREFDQFDGVRDVIRMLGIVAVFRAWDRPSRMHHDFRDKATHRLDERFWLRQIASDNLNAIKQVLDATGRAPRTKHNGHGVFARAQKTCEHVRSHKSTGTCQQHAHGFSVWHLYGAKTPAGIFHAAW
jgi:hypothetical protein